MNIYLGMLERFYENPFHGSYMLAESPLPAEETQHFGFRFREEVVRASNSYTKAVAISF